MEQGDIHLLHLNQEPEVLKAVEFYVLTMYAAMLENSFLIRVEHLYILLDFLRTQLCSLLVIQYYSYPLQSFSLCFVLLTWLVLPVPWWIQVVMGNILGSLPIVEERTSGSHLYKWCLVLIIKHDFINERKFPFISDVILFSPGIVGIFYQRLCLHLLKWLFFICSIKVLHYVIDF